MLRQDTPLSAGEHATPREAERGVMDAAERTFVEFVAAANPVRAGGFFDLHRHEEDQLAWMGSGSLELAVGSDRWHLRRDHAAWIPSGVLHEMRFAEPGELVSVYVDPSHRPDGGDWDRARVIRFDALGGALLRHLAADGVPTARRQACFGVLRDLVRTAPVSHEVVALPHDGRARAIAAALLADPADDRDLVAWAAGSGVSAKTIARAFIADTGRTFREWRVRARLHAAVGLLLRGDPVNEVAPAVGYDSVSSFISAFRTRFGVTPAAYAARSRDSDG